MFLIAGRPDAHLNVKGNMKFRGAALVVAGMASVLSGCASAPLAFAGRTMASPQLQKDTLKLISMAFEAKTKCKTLDAVETEVLAVDPDIRRDQSGVLLKGPIKEKWTALGCGQRMPLVVTFTPDGKGGAFIGLKF
jgi:hypothetical protein